jgi:hypothetical protein
VLVPIDHMDKHKGVHPYTFEFSFVSPLKGLVLLSLHARTSRFGSFFVHRLALPASLPPARA